MSKMDRDYTEKRDFIRMRLETSVILLHGGQSIEALCHDLSSTGMRLEADCQVQLGDQVKVLISSGHTELKELVSDAQVVRITPTASGRLMLGLNVLAMS